jgi:hypothetical protein
MSRMQITNINGHNVALKDLRPIMSKKTPMCMSCGITGLRNLKKERCKHEKRD